MTGLCRWGLGRLALIAAAAAAAAAAAGAPGEMDPSPSSSSEEEPVHLFSEVFFCQRDSPFEGLVQTLDDDLLFWFNFADASWHAHLPDLQPAVQNRTSWDQVRAQKGICDTLLPFLTNFSDRYVQAPESRGIPQVVIFTLHPLQLGQPNTLVCSASNIFPAMATASWAHHDQAVDQAVTSSQVYPIQGPDFQMFSYLEVIPQMDDVYSCTIRGPGDKFVSMAYWVPRDPIASKLLENILCGFAVAVGGIFTLAGATLLILRSTD